MAKTRWKIAQFFERKWWQNYLAKKDAAAYLAWKKRYWEDFLKDIQLEKTAVQYPILDLGCGPAGIFMLFDKEELYALDPLLNEYEHLSIFSKSKYSNTQFINSSFETFNTAQQFETVFCLNAINHFIDIETSFKNLAKRTSKNGTLILSVDAHNFSLFRWLFAVLPLDILHPHQYYLKEYEQFLTQQGFKIIKRKLKKKDFFFSYWILVAKKPN